MKSHMNPFICYCVFSTYPDGDSYTTFNLEGIFKTLADAKIYTMERCRKVHPSHPIHESATEANNFTYIGKRTEFDGEMSHYDDEWYLIEEMNIQ